MQTVHNVYYLLLYRPQCVQRGVVIAALSAYCPLCGQELDAAQAPASIIGCGRAGGVLDAMLRNSCSRGRADCPAMTIYAQQPSREEDKTWSHHARESRTPIMSA